MPTCTKPRSLSPILKNLLHEPIDKEKKHNYFATESKVAGLIKKYEQ
jgi:hypothetical protein